MKTIEVSVAANGMLKLPAGVSLPAHTRIAVLALGPDDPSGAEIAKLAEACGSFDFLKEEPDFIAISTFCQDGRIPGSENNFRMFRPGEIARAAFPFTDLSNNKRRPCLVL